MHSILAVLEQYYSLWYNYQQSDEVLWIKYKVFLLDDVSKAPGQQAPPGGKQRCYNNTLQGKNVF